VIILEVRELIVITDYFVIASGATERHVRTIADEIEKVLGGAGSRPIRREGVSEGRWALLDFADIVVHVFTEEDRAYYELERLWKDAPRVAFSEPAPRRTTRTGSP
jgi:ribosome-associated protein